MKVRDGDKIIEVNTPCKDCMEGVPQGGMKSSEGCFQIGWHVHASGNGYIYFIDDALMEKYYKRWPGGPIQQLIEGSE